jgi:uncharacterized protein YqgC (DUF456 family)
MQAILDALLFVHFLGLMFGAGGGFGSTIAARHAASLPTDQAGAVRALGPALANLSMAGLVLMWLSGVSLLAMKYDFNFGAMPFVFWVKMGFVTSLTIAATLITLTYGQIRRGNAAAASRLPRLGPVAGMSSLAAVVFAVLAFH